MTWRVDATHGVGTFSREFSSLTAARAWELGMTCLGYEATVPVGVGRHLTVIGGGQGTGSHGHDVPAATRKDGNA